MNHRVAAYARVSTERQAEAQTIEQQVERLRAHARERGWALSDEWIFRDDGHSGARLDRPALDRLRDAVARGGVDVLLVTSPDRLARRYAYQVWLLEEWERAGCAVVFLDRPPTGDPHDALVVQIRGAVAEYERVLIADRTRRGRLAALRAGRLLPWSTPPYGYRLDPLRPRDPAGVRVEPAEAEVVRRIFAWYLEDGCTLYGIVQRLAAAGLPTPTGRPFWSPSSVHKILRNHTYHGTAYGNQKQAVPARRRHPLIGREPKTGGGESWRLRPRDEWIPVAVPAIVSEDRFALAQQRLDRNRQWATRNTRGDYLLRRLLSCRRCGLAHSVYNNGRYAYYRCKGMDVLFMRGRPEPCHARQLATARLDAVVWEDVRLLLTSPEVLQDALQRARAGWLDGDERAARQRDLRQRVGQTERQVQRLVDAYEAEALTLDELRSRRARLQERAAALRREEQRLAADAVHDTGVDRLIERVEEFRAAVGAGLERATFAQRRALVELLVDRVVVDAPDVEIRYVVPLTGLAQRQGVLRPRHLQGVVAPGLAPVLGWEGQVGEHLGFDLVQQRGQAGEAAPEGVGDRAPLLAGAGRVGLHEHGPDRRGDHLLGALLHPREGGSHEVGATPLPARALQDGRERRREAAVGVAGDQLHAGEAAGDQVAQEPQPELAVLARADVQPQHLALAARVDPDRDDDRHRDDPAPGAHLDERGVQPHVRVRPGERPRAEAGDLGVQLLAEAADLALADAGHPQRLDQLVHAARRDALHVRLLHHRQQRPLGPPPRLQQAGEEAPIPHPRHRQLDRPHPRVPLPLAVPVALAPPLGAALVPLRAQVLAHLQLHQRLRQHPHPFPQEVAVLQLRLAQQVLQCHPELVGHRVGSSIAV
jgi:site-specific DNA recombinase